MSEIVIINWEIEQLGGVEARAVRGDVQVVRSFRARWPEGFDPEHDPAETGGALRRALAGQGVTATKALVVLPREAVFARGLDLPQAPDEELPDLVKFQAAAKSSTPVDTLTLDYLPWPPLEGDTGRRVLAFTIDAQRIGGIKTALAGAGLEAVGCGVSPACVATLVARRARQVGLVPEAPTLIVHQHGALIEISILDRGQLVFSHGTRLPDQVDDGQHVQPLHAELARSIIALQQAHHGVEIAQVALLQEGPPDEHVRAALEKRFPGLVRALDVARDLSAGVRLPADREHVPATALGMLVSHVEPGLTTIDFLRPRRPVVRPDRRKLHWSVGAAAAAVLLLGGYFAFGAVLSSRDAEIERLQGRRAELDGLLKKGDPQMKAASALGAWESPAPSLEALAEFQDLFPGTDRMYFTTLKYSPETKGDGIRLRGDGLAKHRRDVQDFEQVLVEHGHKVTSRPPLTSRRDPDYPVAFELEVVLQSRPAPAASSQGTATAGDGSTPGKSRS
jgi:hypothetical protein